MKSLRGNHTPNAKIWGWKYTPPLGGETLRCVQGGTHFYIGRQGTMMPLQILINILLAMEYGHLRIETHRYSCPEGLPPLLVSSNHISLTCHFRNLIQARSDNGELDREFGSKRRKYEYFEN